MDTRQQLVAMQVLADVGEHALDEVPRLVDVDAQEDLHPRQRLVRAAAGLLVGLSRLEYALPGDDRRPLEGLSSISPSLRRQIWGRPPRSASRVARSD